MRWIADWAFGLGFILVGIVAFIAAVVVVLAALPLLLLLSLTVGAWLLGRDYRRKSAPADAPVTWEAAPAPTMAE